MAIFGPNKKSLEDKIAYLERENKYLILDKSNLEEEVENLNVDKSSLEKKVKNLNKQVETLSSSNINISNELKTLKLKKEEVRYLDLDIETIKLNEKISELKNEISNFRALKESLHSKIMDLDYELEMQSYGFYKQKYNFESSEVYQSKLNEITSKQKELVKNKNATNHNLNWAISGNTKEGKKFILNSTKLALRAFNNESDNIIARVKVSNVNKSKERIEKIYSEINTLTEMQNMSIKAAYLNLKIEELYLKYEFENKKQQEKEEQEEIRARMREEAKVLKELEEARKKIEKEETHFNNAILALQKKLNDTNGSDAIERGVLEDKIFELENKLKAVQKDKEDVENRTQNTRAGYVYVISNIGSFGKDVYKIGMTRRLDPFDRVKELGGASVPFKFDIHATIFSEDAPTLENKLHKKFEKNSINKVNLRKEFFKVSLDDIKSEVMKNHNATINFTMLAEAPEYRQSLSLDKSIEPVEMRTPETKQNSSNISNNRASINIPKHSKPITRDTASKSTDKSEPVLLPKEEEKALNIVKEALKNIVNTNDVTYRRYPTQFDITYKNNLSYWICKLSLNDKPKILILPDENQKPVIYDMDDVDDLKGIKSQLISIVKRYCNK